MSIDMIKLVGGVAIGAMGLTYMLSGSVARTIYYARKFGMKGLMERYLSEETGVQMIRFGLGPVLLLTGLGLIVVART